MRLAERLDAARLAAIKEVHTAAGKNKVEITAFPDWVPAQVMRAAKKLPIEDATALLAVVLMPNPTGSKRKARSTKRGSRSI